MSRHHSDPYSPCDNTRPLTHTLNEKDLLTCRPWGTHTAFTNRAGQVVRHIRQHFGEVELCTTAWAKMYECIAAFDLLPSTSSMTAGKSGQGQLANGQPAVGTVHLCEAPGAFISASNHFIRTQRYTLCCFVMPSCERSSLGTLTCSLLSPLPERMCLTIALYCEILGQCNAMQCNAMQCNAVQCYASHLGMHHMPP